jgi:hypothetical protein
VTSCRAPARVGAEWRFEALLALVDGEPAGLALFFPDFLTWRGGPGLYSKTAMSENKPIPDIA